MSYDYMFFRLAKAIASHKDLSEDAVQVIGKGSEIAEKLQSIFPQLSWRKLDTRIPGTQSTEPEYVLFGAVTTSAGLWFEFLVPEDSSKSFSVKTSFRADSRQIIEKICDQLGLIAFDGQKLELLGRINSPGQESDGA